MLFRNNPHNICFLLYESNALKNLLLLISSITKSFQNVVLTISDNGIGFPDNLIHRATEAYVTTRSKGTGLGLAIIKKIAQDHCGTLELGNNPEGGAIVTITFDLNRLPDQKSKQ